jgi:hypothetical protein
MHVAATSAQAHLVKTLEMVGKRTLLKNNSDHTALRRRRLSRDGASA